MSATATAGDTPAVVTPYRNVILFSVVLCSGLQSMDTFLAAVALPSMRGEMSASIDEISWVLTAYLIAIAIASPPIGWLSRRLGRKRFMLTTIVLFLIFSMLAGRSTSLTEIVTFRFLQGLSAAAPGLSPSSKTGGWPLETPAFRPGSFELLLVGA